MKLEKHTNGFESIATLRWTAPRSERQYLRDQRGLALQGMRRTLTQAGRHVSRILDPRPWARQHPVAGATLLFGVTALALTAARDHPADRSGRIRRVLGAGARVLGRGIAAVTSALARSWAASLAVGLVQHVLEDGPDRRASGAAGVKAEQLETRAARRVAGEEL